MTSIQLGNPWMGRQESVMEEVEEVKDEEEDADNYHIKYTGLGNMLKRVVENRSTIEKEVPAEKATKVQRVVHTPQT